MLRGLPSADTYSHWGLEWQMLELIKFMSFSADVCGPISRYDMTQVIVVPALSDVQKLANARRF